MADPAILFLAVDAIPYQMAHDAWSSGGLPGFREPLPMVAPFPSLTNVAVPSLLRGVFDTRSPGYEVSYYDPAAGEMCGGLTDETSEAALQPFHSRPRGAFAHAMVYLLRRPLAYGQARWIAHQFLEEGGPWLGYVSATDGVAHFGGYNSLVKAFRDVCGSVVDALEAHTHHTGQRAEAVLCSDHGMAFGRFAHLSSLVLKDKLGAAGFRADTRRPNRTVLAPFGDVGAGVAYVDRSRAPAVANIVAQAEGVDLAFGKTDDGCVCFGVEEASDRPASARIRWRDDSYRYEPISGDPLGYDEIWGELERGGHATDGWVKDADLFAATWSHAYPDAMARVRSGLEDLVSFPAQVLFSMKETYTYGPPLTHLGAQLMGGQVATHGGLGASESVGFATCTDGIADGWQGAPALRPYQVFTPWRRLVRAGSVAER